MMIRLSLAEYLLTYGYDLALDVLQLFQHFITAQLLYNISYVLFVLIVNYFSSILWCEDDMIFAHPFRMCE